MFFRCCSFYFGVCTLLWATAAAVWGVGSTYSGELCPAHLLYCSIWLCALLRHCGISFCWPCLLFRPYFSSAHVHRFFSVDSFIIHRGSWFIRSWHSHLRAMLRPTRALCAILGGEVPGHNNWRVLQAGIPNDACLFMMHNHPLLTIRAESHRV